MALVTRLTRLFRADAHHLLDTLEVPEVVLKQSIRDMRQVLQDTAHERQQLDLQREGLQRSLDHLRRDAEDRQPHIDAALDAGRPELARPLIRRQLEQQRLAVRLEGRIAELAEATGRLATLEEDRHSRLEQICRQAEALDVLASNAPPPSGGGGDSPCAVSDAEVETALLMACQARRSSCSR